MYGRHCAVNGFKPLTPGNCRRVLLSSGLYRRPRNSTGSAIAGLRRHRLAGFPVRVTAGGESRPAL